jgi:hypothetical protein
VSWSSTPVLQINKEISKIKKKKHTFFRLGAVAYDSRAAWA